MNNTQKKAWKWLTKEEQDSLFLTLGTGKSSWEVGEMMKKSHYKYLEIRERSEALFKLFNNFLEIHPSIFRPMGPCQEDFKDYIEALICHRKSRSEALLYSGKASNLINEVSNKKIINNIRRLKNSTDMWDIDTLRLIFEFDKWNNFRILPKMFQLPSAYKRRINKKHKIYIRYMLDTRKRPKWLIDKIYERFYFKTRKEENVYYIALISFECFRDNGYKVISVKKDQSVIDELSKFYIYVFDKKDDADSFGFKVVNFKIQTSKVKLGLKFWPEYRSVIEKAINYKEVNNLNFSIKNIDSSYKKI